MPYTRPSTPCTSNLQHTVVCLLLCTCFQSTDHGLSSTTVATNSRSRIIVTAVKLCVMAVGERLRQLERGPCFMTPPNPRVLEMVPDARMVYSYMRCCQDRLLD